MGNNLTTFSFGENQVRTVTINGEPWFVAKDICDVLEIVDVSKLPKNGKVVFGVTVELINIDNDEKVIYQIVGEDEADIKLGLVNIGSPIARALIGKEQGDTVYIRSGKDRGKTGKVLHINDGTLVVEGINLFKNNVTFCMNTYLIELDFISFL